MAAINAVVDLGKDGDIAIVTVNSPPVNALSADVRDGLDGAFKAIAGDASVKAVVLVCAGRTFIAGAVPGIHGLWAVTGDNEAGVTHAPALGRMMAELVTQHIRPEINNASFALARFTQAYADEQAVAAAMPPRR